MFFTQLPPGFITTCVFTHIHTLDPLTTFIIATFRKDGSIQSHLNKLIKSNSLIETSWYPLYAHSYLNVQGPIAWGEAPVCVQTWYVCSSNVHLCEGAFFELQGWMGWVCWGPDRRPLCSPHQALFITNKQLLQKLPLTVKLKAILCWNAEYKTIQSSSLQKDLLCNISYRAQRDGNSAHMWTLDKLIKVGSRNIICSQISYFVPTNGSLTIFYPNLYLLPKWLDLIFDH